MTYLCLTYDCSSCLDVSLILISVQIRCETGVKLNGTSTHGNTFDNYCKMRVSYRGNCPIIVVKVSETAECRPLLSPIAEEPSPWTRSEKCTMHHIVLKIVRHNKMKFGNTFCC